MASTKPVERRKRVGGICGASQLSGIYIHYQMLIIDLHGASNTVYKPSVL